MKKLIITSLAFVFLMLIPFSIINIFQSHYNTTPEFYKLQYDAVQKSSSHFEGIIIGSSRAACSIRPSILDSSGIAFYNFALPGAGPEYYYNWYNRVFLDHQTASRYCILEFNSFIFDSHVLRRKLEQDSEFFSHFLFLKLFLGLDGFNKKDAFVNRFPVLKYRKAIARSLKFQKGDINNPVSTYDRGYNSSEGSYNPKKFLINKKCMIDSYQVICFIKLIEQMVAEKVKIVLVMPPEYGFEPEFYKRSRAFFIINEISKKYQIPVLNFNTDLRSHINEDVKYFSDWQHLNGRGSLFFSRKLAEELCRLIIKP